VGGLLPSCDAESALRQERVSPAAADILVGAHRQPRLGVPRSGLPSRLLPPTHEINSIRNEHFSRNSAKDR
jgi:hypothetical protein